MYSVFSIFLHNAKGPDSDSKSPAIFLRLNVVNNTTRHKSIPLLTKQPIVSLVPMP